MTKRYMMEISRNVNGIYTMETRYYTTVSSARRASYKIEYEDFSINTIRIFDTTTNNKVYAFRRIDLRKKVV